MKESVCLLIALCACVCAEGPVPRKGFFCQDPDTGLLHGVNTTWPSTSFCGNYTCKIRAKNHTMETSESRTIINITRPLDSVLKKITNNTNITQALGNSQLGLKEGDVFFNEKEGGEAKSDVHRNSVNIPASIKLPLSNDGGDRYLTSEEIKTITELLHTVKKSDLEAIIEIYNLAQDIYKEMDEEEASNTNSLSTTSENDTLKSVKGEEVDSVKKDRKYWYEPFILNEFYRLSDLKSEGSEIIPISTNPISNTQRPPYNSPTPTTYFSGTLLNNQDFGKLPYYYPISEFQRWASYYHQQQRPYSARSAGPSPPNSCYPCTSYPYSTTSVRAERIYNRPTPPAQQSLLLPYPFLNPFTNETSSIYNNYNNYYRSNPWAYYDYYKNNPHSFFKLGASKHNNDNPNGEPKPEVKTTTVKPTDELKPWQTEPLSEELINEIRANIAERAKLLKMPLRKRIRLDRVAKVKKLDQLNKPARVARHAKEEDAESEEKKEFEVYIEKTTCSTDTELGYFRVGNMSQPFPACCPQKIEGR